jgi:hypothetical protein
MYSYLVEGLPEGHWRWTVFGEDRKIARSGNAKTEHDARLAALQAIHDLKQEDEAKNA